MDPYKVLGVSPDASDDEIRSAYRALAKKYHPDNYVNSPIADVAAEKMKEVNAAYEQIQQLRKGGASSAYSGSSSHSSPGGIYATIRTLISQGNIGRAEAMLNEIPIQQRGGEWYFCMGSVCYRRGWMDRAAECFRTAADNDPTNREYAAAAERMNGTRQVYRQRGASGSSGGISGCDICTSLLCADCLCECMGGDLIPCC